MTARVPQWYYELTSTPTPNYFLEQHSVDVRQWRRLMRVEARLQMLIFPWEVVSFNPASEQLGYFLPAGISDCNV